MTGERSYTTKIWRPPSLIGFSSADALSTSMDPPGEPVISTWKRPCQKIQNGSEFPELVAQNSQNPQLCIDGAVYCVHRGCRHRFLVLYSLCSCSEGDRVHRLMSRRNLDTDDVDDHVHKPGCPHSLYTAKVAYRESISFLRI